MNMTGAELSEGPVLPHIRPKRTVTFFEAYTARVFRMGFALFRNFTVRAKDTRRV